MQYQLEIAAAIAVVITVVSGIIYLTRFVTQLQSKLAVDQLQLTIRDLEDKVSDANSRYRDLMNQVVNSRSSGSGTEALITKLDIEQDLSQLMRLLDVDAGSVYIPLRSKNTQKVAGLIFAAALPRDQYTDKLRKKVFRLDKGKGYAVTVFRTGKASLANDATQDPEHLEEADAASGYSVRNAITVPLSYEGELVGVLQVLNRRVGLPQFDQDDIARVDFFGRNLAIKVAKFIHIQDHLSVLGISGDRDAEQACVVFVDLTNSSQLFASLPGNLAIQHINEFLENVCDVAFQFGATVDKYTGDGVFLRFNVPKPVSDPEHKALAASVEMVRSFRQLKEQWRALNSSVEHVFVRVGIASGSVYQAICGHPQSQYLTLFGPPVNVAANLCEFGTRAHDTIVIDTNMYQVVKEDVGCFELPKDKFTKIARFTSSAYEVQV